MKNATNMATEKKVAVIMGSDSDLPVAKKALDVLDKLGIPAEARIISAHRTPDAAAKFSDGAEENGFGAIIAIAGKAAHLAGAIAGRTALPVIGVPVSGHDLGGLDALLSTVQMPSGVPVASVAIDGGANAAWLAARMLAIGNAELSKKLRAEAARMAAEVEAKDAGLNEKLREGGAK